MHGGAKDRSPEPIDALPSMILLQRLQQGDDRAREELIRRYWPRLQHWARGRLPRGARDLYDTNDLVQETMVAALGRLDDFTPEHNGSLLAYLRTVILNRVRRLAQQVGNRGEKVEVDSRVFDPAPSPLEQAIGREVLERYESALRRLRTEDREAIHLRLELGLPYSEIAAEMNKPTLIATRKAVSRAVARLAREMGHV
jgi:RNA polymerase sigma-70 factor (ECF subfamily)